MTPIEIMAETMAPFSTGGKPFGWASKASQDILIARSEAAVEALEKAGYQIIKKSTLQKMADKHEVSLSELLDV